MTRSSYDHGSAHRSCGGLVGAGRSGHLGGKVACQVAGRYYKAVRYAKDYKCKKILVGPVHRLYILR